VVVEASTYRNKLRNDKRRKDLLYDTGIFPKLVGCQVEVQSHTLHTFTWFRWNFWMRSNVLVVEEDPGLKETYTGSRCIWVLTDRRVSWASLFGV
jgi:hypothetical protein